MPTRRCASSRCRNSSQPAPRPGIASIVLDNDGTLRRVPRYPDGFAAVLAASRRRDAGRRAGRRAAADVRPGAHLPTVSYYQALSPDEFLPKDFFRGSVVIVGLSLQSAPAADAGGADSYATSFTLRSRHLVSGAEIQATIYENITRQPVHRCGLALAAGRLHDRRGAARRRRGLARHRLADGRAGRAGHRRLRSPAASCCCSSAGSTCRRSRRRSPSSRSRRRRARATTPPSGGCGAASCAPSRNICRRPGPAARRRPGAAASRRRAQDIVDPVQRRARLHHHFRER